MRIAVHPVHYNLATGELHPKAFSDVKDKGLSVVRAAHATINDINIFMQKYLGTRTAAGEKRELGGAVAAACGRLRSILTEQGERIFCVYDTGLLELPAHADVCIASDRSAKRATKLLLEAFGIVTTLEAAHTAKS